VGSIRGRTIITLGDRLRALWTRSSKIALGVFAIVIAGITVVGDRPAMGSTLDTAIYVVSILSVILLMILFWLLIVVALISGLHRYTSREQRDVAYEFNDSSLTVRDAAGASVSCPWSIVRNARETARAIRLEIRPMASRYIPKRAFAPADIVAVRVLLKEKLGKAAKLKV
jgi:hypothetical protein